jgi:hypothetical protein
VGSRKSSEGCKSGIPAVITLRIELAPSTASFVTRAAR